MRHLDRLILSLITDIDIRRTRYYKYEKELYDRIRSSPVIKDPDVRRNLLKTFVAIVIFLISLYSVLKLINWENTSIYVRMIFLAFLSVAFFVILYFLYKTYSLLAEKTGVKLFKSAGVMICTGVFLILSSGFWVFAPDILGHHTEIVRIGSFHIDSDFMAGLMPFASIALGIFIIFLGQLRLGVAWRKYLKMEEWWDKVIF